MGHFQQSISPGGVPPETRVLPEADWLERRRRHEARVEPWVTAERERASAGIGHPVYDFLFDYYSFRPSRLWRWHAGLGTVLAGSRARQFLRFREYSRWSAGVGPDPARLADGRRQSVAWILQLLEGCRDRPPHFGCFGAHEWAMVYRSPDIRHSSHPLRLSPDEIAQVVESLPIRCSHFDAFRFFTPEARPLNRLQPCRELQQKLDQRGCLHVNMDLYKWAYKLSPWTGSDLVAECFLLAARVREVDMRASPYDFRALGFEPIAIETSDGRAEYERFQREFASAAIPLRGALISLCQRLLAATEPPF